MNWHNLTLGFADKLTQNSGLSGLKQFWKHFVVVQLIFTDIISKTFSSFMFYRISQHSTFLYLMNPKFTKVGIIEDQLIDSIYPSGTIYQKLGHRDGAFFSDSKMRTSFHPRLQQCLDGISVQEWYWEISKDEIWYASYACIYHLITLSL